MEFARADNLGFVYPDSASAPALQKLNFCLDSGRHIAILGANGSGKSSLAKLLAALFEPSSGSLSLFGLSPHTEENVQVLRSRLGIVFQNPDNQIVATTVEEDVAFGLENRGIANPLLRQRVDEALELVGLSPYAQNEPTELSGGQKQKLALAGILVMRPDVLLLDEATSMLDPMTARELFDFIRALAAQKDLTLINITHDMEEALTADEVMVLKEGQLAYHGSVQTFFKDAEMSEFHLLLPQLLYIMRELGIPYDLEGRDQEESLRELTKVLLDAFKAVPMSQSKRELAQSVMDRYRQRSADILEREVVVAVRDLSYTYRPDLPLAHEALRHLSMDLRRGEILSILGPSGAGKSTLVWHLNALLKKQSGEIEVLGQRLNEKTNIRDLRQKVGLVFQYPETQLFAETVREDIAFGPRQMGLSSDEVERRVQHALELVGLSPDFLERSPFELSGGEMRRVALAGVLAMETEILVLDEPSAGLDPAASREMVKLLKQLRDEGRSLILVTHDMEDAAELSDRVLLLNQGEVLAHMLARDLFYNPQLLARGQLEQTAGQSLMAEINQTFGLDLRPQSSAEILEILRLLLREETADGL